MELYALINKQTGEIINTPTSKNKYYKSINTLSKAYETCITNKHKLTVSINDIGFKKFILVGRGLSSEEMKILTDKIQTVKQDRAPTKLKNYVKYKSAIEIKFIKENKIIRGYITGHPFGYKLGENNRIKEYALKDVNSTNIYYLSKTMSELRDKIYKDYLNGVINIPDINLC